MMFFGMRKARLEMINVVVTSRKDDDNTTNKIGGKGATAKTIRHEQVTETPETALRLERDTEKGICVVRECCVLTAADFIAYDLIRCANIKYPCLAQGSNFDMVVRYRTEFEAHRTFIELFLVNQDPQWVQGQFTYQQIVYSSKHPRVWRLHRKW